MEGSDTSSGRPRRDPTPLQPLSSSMRRTGPLPNGSQTDDVNNSPLVRLRPPQTSQSAQHAAAVAQVGKLVVAQAPERPASAPIEADERDGRNTRWSADMGLNLRGNQRADPSGQALLH